MNSSDLFKELSESGVVLQRSKGSSNNNVLFKETANDTKKTCFLTDGGLGPTLVGFYPHDAKNMPREFASCRGFYHGTRFKASEEMQYRIVSPEAFLRGEKWSQSGWPPDQILPIPPTTMVSSPENYCVDFGFKWEQGALEALDKPEELLYMLSEHGIRMYSTASRPNDNRIGIARVKSGSGKEYIVDNVLDIYAIFCPDKTRKLPEKILTSNSDNIPIIIQTGDVLWRLGGYTGDAGKYLKAVEIPKYLNAHSGL